MAVSVKIDDDLKARLQTVAEAEQRSPHWIMHEAIREYVDRAEKQRRFDEHTLRSMQEYEETGLHLTWEEVRSAMETWGTDDERELPECHT